MSERFRREDGMPTIGLAMIVRDEADRLGRLFDSVGWVADPELAEADGEGAYRPEAAVDFVVICDTGSEDSTRELARERGARVVEFEWCDDFSAARQASYDALPDVDFTLWADADDVIEGAELLRQIAANLPPQVAATVHRYDYAQDPSGNCLCELWRERLVRHGIGERWKLPIHEVLEIPAGAMVRTDQVIWHHRTADKEAPDPERNYRILKAHATKARKRGEQADARTLAYLGTEAMAVGKLDEGRECFREYLDGVGEFSEERCQVSHKLSICHRLLADQNPDQEAEFLRLSEQAAFGAIHERPDWPDGYLDLAELALRADEPEKALHFCEAAERLPVPQTMLIINPLEYAYQPLLMRSVALGKLGRVEEAFEATEQALGVTPYREDLRAQLAGVGVQMRIAQAKDHLLGLREMLVRHDENEKAQRLMDCAPYFIWDQPDVAQARLDQREMTLHAFDPRLYGSYYRENPGEAPFEMQGVPIAEAHERFHRVQFLRDGLTEQATSEGIVELRGHNGKGRNVAVEPLRILDLSANDGWMLANLAEGGFGVTGALHGMDLNRDAVERANEREQLQPSESADEYGGQNREVICADLHTAADHFIEGSYDAVVCFETIEHVPDPGAMLDVMLRMVRPDGRCYVSTPLEAYEQGNVPDWFRVESKGHLRAMRPHDLAALLCERGIVRNFDVDQRVQVAALEPGERRGRIVFYAGPAECQPEKIITEGLGGSETAIAKLAEHFARRGYDVRVYAGAGGGLRGDHLTIEEDKLTGGQVLYAPAGAWNPGERCDLFVSSRLPEAFDRTIAAEKRLLWLHDADYADRLTAERVGRADAVLVMSQFQRDLLTERYPFLAEASVLVTRNGIETKWFTPEPIRRKPWVVYSSSPDRGLDVLLECWPEIREKAIAAGVRSPELHHTYAPVYHEFRKRYPHLARFHGLIEERAQAEGVVSHESMNQRELADLFRRATVWAYPSWNSWAHEAFPEISCISAMEAQAAGCVPVYTEFAALRETVVDGLPVEMRVSGDPPALSERWRAEFIEAVVRGLTDKDLARHVRRNVRPAALGLDWSGVADEWERTFLTDEAEPSAAREKVAA